MTTTSDYQRTYYATHKDAIMLRISTSRDRWRTDAACLTRAEEVRARMARHTLTIIELAVVLDISDHLIGCWLMRPTSRAWHPVPVARLTQLRALLPENAPMSDATIARLGWSGLRCQAYHASWTHDIPPITAEALLAWRIQVGMTQPMLAQKLDVTVPTIRRWETGKKIPTWQQWCLWWVMDHTKKDA